LVNDERALILRNVRRFNEVEVRLEKATAEFEPFFFQAFDQMCKHELGSLANLPMRPEELYREWIKRTPHTLLGLRVHSFLINVLGLDAYKT
jgi:hypothetical protein